ncbi:hypothetical protein PORY_000515 [Pneumocystis oryctolagi]|uniref:Uncharacterized protein n=1 Tax=Pneumocystis oryctolagi TaxID=42067 RepID=A0ACB7CFG1_9ASCO|nr:hypothetical protein PORY_000515 [Pneumocystis oryctolagi]
MEHILDKKEENGDASLDFNDFDDDEKENEIMDEKSNENEENSLRGDSVTDSSEEEDDDDEEERRKVHEGFIVDDDETDDDVTKIRRHKRKKRLSDRDKDMDGDELDEEDLDLVMENTGIVMTRDVPKFKRLKRRKEKSVSKDLEDIFSDEEVDSVEEKEHVRPGRFTDEFADFIEEDDFGDLDNRREIRREKPFHTEVYFESAGIDSDAHAEVFEIFGDGGDYAYALENEDSEQYERRDVSLHDVFEHSEIVERMLTDMDEIIRVTDIPERIQVLRAPYYHLQLSDDDILKEYEWVSKRLLLSRSDIDHVLLKPFKKAVKNVIDFYNRDFFEPSFIWQNRKDYLLFFEKSNDEKKVSKIHTLLRQSDLWKILDLDLRFRAFIEKRNSFFEIFKNLSVNDKLFEQCIDKVECLEEITDLHDYMYFRYSENIKDMNMSHGSTFKRPSNKYSSYAKIRKCDFYNLVRAFGLPSEHIGKNFLENTKRYFPEDPDGWPEVLAEKYITNSNYSSASNALSENMSHDPDFYLQMINAEDQGLVTVSICLDGYNKLFLEMSELLISDNVSEIASAWNDQRKLILTDLFDKIKPIMEKTIKENLKSDCEDSLAFFCRKKFLDKLDRTPYPLKSLDKGEVPRVLTISNGRGDPTKDDTSCVFVDEDGKVLEHIRISDIHEENSKKELFDFIKRRNPDVIGISGFSVSVDFLRKSLKDIVDTINVKQNDTSDYIKVVYVNDDVARLYQNSERANKEFPNLPSLGKYCVSLARYMQSPLMEYAAMGNDITSISFHPWQHLIPRDKLQRVLETAIVDIVNLVGVDINDVIRSSYKLNLLPYVCGLGPRKAQSLCKRISLVGGYISNRAELITKSIVTRNIFINCASFLKIPYNDSSVLDSSEVLDSTRVHPEDYELARKMAADALELDEEDVEEYDSSGGIVVHLMNDDPDKLSDLILEEYAEQLEKVFQQLKRNTLETIRDELQNPYEELRKDYKDITDQEIFTMLTGETSESLKPGSVISVTVKKIGTKGVTVKLNCGIDGFIANSQVSDNYNVSPSQVLQYGHTVQAVVLSLNLQKFTVELSAKASSIKEAYKNQKNNLLNRKFEWDSVAEEKDRSKIALKKDAEQRITRVIKHPLFKPFNARQAEDYLASMQRGDVVIRPSSSGPDHITITWKISEGIYQHIDVLELDKENEFSVGRQLRVRGKEQNYSYSDLDELIVSHVKSIARKIDEMTTNEKFQKGTRAETVTLEQWLNRYSEANPRRSCYAFCFNPKYPGFFDLCFKANLKSKVVSWSVKVVPNAFSLKGNLYGDMNTLCNGFKMMFAAQANNRSIKIFVNFIELRFWFYIYLFDYEDFLSNIVLLDLRKTYGRLRVLDEIETIDSIEHEKISDPLGSSVSLSPGFTVCSNVELTPRSKVKTILAEFDIDEPKLSDNKYCNFSSNEFEQRFSDKGYFNFLEKDVESSYLSEGLPSGIVYKDSAYERVKKMLINKGTTKSDKYSFNTSHSSVKVEGECYQKEFNNDESNVFDTSLFLDSKFKSNSDKCYLSENVEFTGKLKSKEKSCLIESDQKKYTSLKMRKAVTSCDDISDCDLNVGGKYPLVKKKFGKAISKKAIEEMQKETERIDRGMSLAPEIKVDKKISILSFLKKVGYKSDVMQNFGSHESTEVVSDSNTSFTNNNCCSQNSDNFLDMSFKDQMPFSLNFGGSGTASKFSKASRACLVSKQIKTIDHQSRKKLIFKTSVSENSSDSELEVEPLICSPEKFKKSKSFMYYKKANVYSDLARLRSPSQKSRIKNKLFDYELLARAAEQIKLERLAREEELKQKGVILTSFEERAKEVTQIEDLIEKERLRVENIRKDEIGDHKDDDSDDGNDLWNEDKYVIHDDKESDEDVCNDNSSCDNNNDKSIGINSDYSDYSDLENVENEETDYDENVRFVALCSEEAKRSRCIVDEMHGVIKTKIRRNNNRRIITDDENECNPAYNTRSLQDSVDDTFNLSQFFFCTLPKDIDNDSCLQNSVIDKKGIDSSLDTVRLSENIHFELSQIETDVNLDSLDKMNDSDPKLLCSFDNGNSEKMEREFENTQLSMFDPPSSDSALHSLSVVPTYSYSDIGKADFGVGEKLPSNALIGMDFKRKKRLGQRVPSNNDYNDFGDNNDDFVYTKMSSKYNVDVNDKYIINKPEEFIEDQAQESDDEYAGLGGLSDEEDDLNDAKEIEDMIDNTVSVHDIDTSDISAYYMKKKVDDDMKIINNLFNDITTGNLRKRRGAMLFDLDDDDDDDDERLQRRNKRAQAIRQKLLDNQNLSFMVNNPKMKAFLSTIEDNEENLVSFVDFTYEESVKLQKNNDNIKDLVSPNTPLNINDNSVNNTTFGSRISCCDKNIDIEKELAFFVDKENIGVSENQSTDNDAEKRFNNLTNVVDRMTSISVPNEPSYSSSLAFGIKKKTSNLFSKAYFYEKRNHLFNNDSSQIEKKKNVLSEIFKTNSIKLASKLASRAVNYNRRAAIEDSKDINSKILYKKVIDEKRKSSVLKLFRNSVITV